MTCANGSHGCVGQTHIQASNDHVRFACLYHKLQFVLFLSTAAPKLAAAIVSADAHGSPVLLPMPHDMWNKPQSSATSSLAQLYELTKVVHRAQILALRASKIKVDLRRVYHPLLDVTPPGIVPLAHVTEKDMRPIVPQDE